jgi:HSP20 family protein
MTMLELTRWSPFDDMFSFHREIDRLFNRAWSDLSARAAAPIAPTFQVQATDDAWKVAVPMPGIDPKHVNLEVTGNTLSIRAEQPVDQDAPYARFEQTITVPQFVDLDKVTASHRHGLLELTLPFKESVKPRRIQIETAGSDTKRLNAAA